MLFPNGDLLVLWELFGLFKLDRDSNLLWAVTEHVHHDLQVTKQGEIVHLQSKLESIPGIPGKPAIADFIVTRNAEGLELRKLAMSEALKNADWLGLRRAFWIRAMDRSYGLTKRGLHDPFHTNSLWLLSAEEADRFGGSFRAGDALVSMAMLDTIAIIDMKKGKLAGGSRAPSACSTNRVPLRMGTSSSSTTSRAPRHRRSSRWIHGRGLSWLNTPAPRRSRSTLRARVASRCWPTETYWSWRRMGGVH